jgi:hypothetical protein
MRGIGSSDPGEKQQDSREWKSKTMRIGAVRHAVKMSTGRFGDLSIFSLSEQETKATMPTFPF